MSIDDLIVSIEQRGYTLRRPVKEPTKGSYTLLYIVRGDECLTVALLYADLHNIRCTPRAVVEWVLSGFSKGQQHKVCRCGEPLLHNEMKQIGIPERVFASGYKTEIPRDNYRSAKAGPDSPVLTSCPACSVRLSHRTVCEIVDAETIDY